MRNFIERHGHKGERKLVIANNRFSGEGDSRTERREDRRERQRIKERDERRFFSLRTLLDDVFSGGIFTPAVSGYDADARYCSTVGVTIPAGGGKVRVDSDERGRRGSLYFAHTGRLVSAHF